MAKKSWDINLDFYHSLIKPFVFKTDPNRISILSLAAAAACGWFLYTQNLLLGFVFLALNGFLDLLDGEIARKYKLSTKYGDLLDHTIDRISDVFVFLGLSLSGLVNPVLGLLVLVLALLVSYLGTQAQALTSKRFYGGLVGRWLRQALLGLALLVTMLGTDALEFYLFAMVPLLVFTFIQRFYFISTGLRE